MPETAERKRWLRAEYHDVIGSGARRRNVGLERALSGVRRGSRPLLATVAEFATLDMVIGCLSWRRPLLDTAGLRI
jgi:hypothetical protein